MGGKNVRNNLLNNEENICSHCKRLFPGHGIRSLGGQVACSEACADRLKPLGLEIDKELNAKIAGFKELHEGKISTNKSSVDIYVIPTNEELMIAEDTYNLI